MTAHSRLQYDPRGALEVDDNVSPAALSDLAPQLEEARREVLVDDLALYRARPHPADESNTPQEKRPLDAGFIELPVRILQEYQSHRDRSELGRILAAADQLRERVDRVVVLGIGGSYMGARALMDACCDPYYNELSRGERGSKPRMYFEGNNIDNDAAQSLRRLLGAGGRAESIEQRWGIVVISKSGGTLETAVAFRQFLADLHSACGGDEQLLAQLVIPVTGASGKLFDLAQALGCPHVFEVPDGVGGRFSVLSAVGLLPAAILGINVVKLLEGACDMNERFRTAPPGDNPVLDYVGVCRLWERQGAHIRVLCAWSKALEAAGLWYDQLLSESLGKDELGATPITAVNTRDLHSRAQQHQQGMRDKLFTNLIVNSWRCDPLGVGQSRLNQDGLNDLADKTLPDLMQAAVEGTNEALHDDRRPTADIVLGRCDEFALGQYLQMMMLATVVEGRLIGVNPYGQPGVQKYKAFMAKKLGRA